MFITSFMWNNEDLDRLMPGEVVWVEKILSDSFENEIFTQVTGRPFGRTVKEYQSLFRGLQFEVEYSEVKRDMAHFQSIEDLTYWISSQIEEEEKTLECLALFEKKGVPTMDGKIMFPTKKMIVRLKKCHNIK